MRSLHSRRTAGFSKKQITRARCRINAAAASKGFGAVRKMELATWRPRNHPLIAFKDAKGIKDCRAAARAIFTNLPRSMCEGPMHREDSRFDCTKMAKIAGSRRVQFSLSFVQSSCTSPLYRAISVIYR